MKIIFVLAFVIFIVTSVALGCGTTSTDVDVSEDPGVELEEVQFAVLVLMNHEDNRIIDLQTDSRIDWAHCARNANEATSNMTGTPLEGGRALIAVADYANLDILDLSNYLELDWTIHRYWIEPTGKVHQVVD